MIVLDFLFPPLCRCCLEYCKTKYLCPGCWMMSELPDPAERCRNCFKERDRDSPLCTQCGHVPFLPATRAYVFDSGAPIARLGFEATDALAAFTYYQWVQLEWDLPDAILSMPDRHSRALAKAFAAYLDRPLISHRDDLEDLEILLFDACNSLENIREETQNLIESFPKRIFIISLLDYDSSYYSMPDADSALLHVSGDENRPSARDLGR